MSSETIDDTVALIDSCQLLRSIADKTIVVRLLNPFVDNGTRPGVDHVWSENGGLIVKVARRDGVAAILGEEYGYRIVDCSSLQQAVAGCHVSR